MIFRHYSQSPLALYTVIIAIHFLQITSFQSFYYPKTIMPSVPKVCIFSPLCVPKPPSRLKFYMLRLISHRKKTVNTFKNNKVLCSRKVTCCIFLWICYASRYSSLSHLLRSVFSASLCILLVRSSRKSALLIMSLKSLPGSQFT